MRRYAEPVQRASRWRRVAGSSQRGRGKAQARRIPMQGLRCSNGQHPAASPARGQREATHSALIGRCLHCLDGVAGSGVAAWSVRETVWASDSSQPLARMSLATCLQGLVVRAPVESGKIAEDGGVLVRPEGAVQRDAGDRSGVCSGQGVPPWSARLGWRRWRWDSRRPQRDGFSEDG